MTCSNESDDHTQVDGRTISHYRVLDELGSGGMGKVYRAEDTKLGRLVALKFLPAELVRDPAALQRFEREARAASALNHPNICTIYEIDDESGEPFIAMELLEGTTLRQRLEDGPCTTEQVIAFGRQIADALDAAHARGILHRDIKPANVFVNRRDQVKLLDFGLAKVSEGAAADTTTFAAPLPLGTQIVTSPGLVQGTIAYMSPEQARGEPLDARSDLFSVGVMLYEAATGRRPFGGGTSAVTFDAILNRDPPPPAELRAGLPDGLAQVILKLLKKDPRLRYASAAALLVDLEALRGDANAVPAEARRTVRRRRPAPIDRRTAILITATIAVVATIGAVLGLRDYVSPSRSVVSVAVLPFTNDTKDAGSQYVSDGLAVGVMNTLSQLASLRVLPRATVARFRSDAPDLPQVGKELGVEALLSGQVTLEAGQPKVGVQLIDVATQSLLWGDTFPPSGDLVEIQERIATAVAERLHPGLSGSDRRRLTKRPTNDPEAYRLYLKGRSLWELWTDSSLERSVDYFREATVRDPGYALAFFGLADVHVALAYLSRPPRTYMPLAKQHVTKALALDDSLAEAHYLLGIIHLYYDWDMPAAERQFKRALALKPRSPEAHFGYGNYLVVGGKLDQARPEVEEAVRLDPHSNTWSEQLAVFYSGIGDLDKAEAQARQTLKLNPTSFWAHFDLGMISARRGQAAQALKEFEQSAALADDNPYALGYFGYGQAIAGRPAAAAATEARLDTLAKTRHVSSYARALISSGLRDRERTFEHLSRARDERDCWLLWYFILDGAFDWLRSDPRHGALLAPLRGVGAS